MLDWCTNGLGWRTWIFRFGSLLIPMKTSKSNWVFTLPPPPPLPILLPLVITLCAAYLSQGRKGKMLTTVTGDLNQVKNGFTYEIDFDAMTELNTKFRATLRPIKREPVRQTSNFSWEICVPGYEWVKFGTLESQQVRFHTGWCFPFIKMTLNSIQIELAFFERKFSTMAIKWQNRQLLLDFKNMKEQTNNWKLHRSDPHYENQLQNRNKNKYSPPPPTASRRREMRPIIQSCCRHSIIQTFF